MRGWPCSWSMATTIWASRPCSKPRVPRRVLSIIISKTKRTSRSRSLTSTWHVHAGLDDCLGDKSRPPLKRVRRFFELTQQNYRREGYLGCLLGGLGQELSGESEVFRRKVEGCFSEIAKRIAVCLEEARKRGDIPAGSNSRRMASLLVDCWEGAALRSRLRGNAAPLTTMLDFYFQSAVSR